MELIRLETEKSPIFEKVFEWSYNWWGKYSKGGEAATRCTLAHSLNTEKLPQTFVAIENGEPVGMYQLSMSDDLVGRPDIYPWLINVYVDEKHRGKKYLPLYDGKCSGKRRKSRAYGALPLYRSRRALRKIRLDLCRICGDL